MIRRKNNPWPLRLDPLDLGRRYEVESEPIYGSLSEARRRLLVPGAQCACGKPATDVRIKDGDWQPTCAECLRAGR